MSVVPAHGAYVVANYKETQLTDVHEGQAVDIAVDMFPGQIVHGHVDSLAPASGQEFALLPPDNATGNFTKVVQRIPVKIALDGSAADLRPGMSVIPSIQTQPQPGEKLLAWDSPGLWAIVAIFLIGTFNLMGPKHTGGSSAG